LPKKAVYKSVFLTTWHCMSTVCALMVYAH